MTAHTLAHGIYHAKSLKHRWPAHNTDWEGKPFLICDTMPLAMPVADIVLFIKTNADMIGASRERAKGGVREHMVKFATLKYEPEFYSEKGLEYRVRQMLLKQCEGQRVRLNVLRSKKSSWEAVGIMQGFESPTKISLAKCTLAKPATDRVLLKDKNIVLKINKVIGIALAA
ncbi:MAG TPA: hypothetical protein VG934_00695 [Candidatus Paceibacterota bacterium]|nr:hypothetical protein [Candidatus Paceibacterota bacterium]